MKEVEIYTDGACSGNPGGGGWCAILIYNKAERIVSGYNKDTTNNRMELYAVIQGLLALKESCSVKIYSDSAYVVNAFVEGWVRQWIAQDWKTSTKSRVKNDDLWRHLIMLVEKHQVEFIKVKGHAENVYNNRCDKIARAEIDKIH